MRISVIGCGYLGAVHAAAMASLGHRVIGIDSDQTKVDLLRNGETPFFEPELQELLLEGIGSGDLSFSTDMKAVRDAEVHFVAVGTPQSEGGQGADLSHVRSAMRELAKYLKDGDVVVGKSTVPVGTAAELTEGLKSRGATLVWNPEFLREGWAVKDTIDPDRIVVGIPDGSAGARASRILQTVYETSVKNGTPFLEVNLETAELVKGAANAFLATKISFINAVAEIAEVSGADVTQIADAIGHDPRIGRRFLGAGLGFGGGCLPKDIRAFAARAEELGQREAVNFLHEVDAINLRRRDKAVELLKEGLGGVLHGKKVTVLGASFKPHSDDIRDSPALDVAVRLKGLGAEVVVTDPEALDNARKLHPQLEYCRDRDSALSGADAVILATEWDEYRENLLPTHAATLVKALVVVDGRNCLDGDAWREAGWTYFGMGKP